MPDSREDLQPRQISHPNPECHLEHGLSPSSRQGLRAGAVPCGQPARWEEEPDLFPSICRADEQRGAFKAPLGSRKSLRGRIRDVSPGPSEGAEAALLEVWARHWGGQENTSSCVKLLEGRVNYPLGNEVNGARRFFSATQFYKHTHISKNIYINIKNPGEI